MFEVYFGARFGARNDHAKVSALRPLRPRPCSYNVKGMETNPGCFFIVLAMINLFIAIVIATVVTLGFDGDFWSAFGTSLVVSFMFDIVAALLRSPSR